MNKKCIYLIFSIFISLSMIAKENRVDTIVGKSEAMISGTKTKKKISVTGIPLISFDRSKGTGFGAIGMGFFKLDNDSETKPSSVMMMGKYTTQKNWNVSAMGNLFFAKDKYRLTIGGGYMNSNFQTFEQMDEANIEIPYNNHGGFFFVVPSVRVWSKLYVGIGGQVFKSHLDMDLPDPVPDSISNSWMNSLALNLMFDTRDSPYNPAKGINSSVKLNFFPDWMKNVDTYYKLHAECNYYFRIDHSKILASRAAMNVGLGDLPFVGQNYIGNRDLRGYTKGEYRGDQTYAAQTELRWNVYHHWGMVGFFGLALAATPKTDYVSPLLPAGGVGVRYLVLPEYHINLGVDAAAGKDDWGVYFRVTEAF